MKLKHFCGRVIELEILDVDPEPQLRHNGGDLFGPLLAGMMFWEFPRCIVDATPHEMELLRKGGFICDGRQDI